MTKYREGRVIDEKTGDTDGRHRQWADSLTLNSASDISKLPWVGNHYSDSELFSLCERFIRKQTDRSTQKDALFLMGKCGMGIEDEVTNEALDDFLSESEASGSEGK